MAKGVSTVAITERLWLRREIEGIPRPARNNEVQRPLIILIQIIALHGFLDLRHGVGQSSAQVRSAFEPHGEHLGRELEIINLDLVHLAHIHVVTLGKQRVGIEGFAQKSGGSTLPHHI